MKKIKFISAIALTLVMASCDNYDLPNPPGQTNGEPAAVFENSGLELKQGDANVNLITANAANEFVTVATVEKLVNFPTDYTLAIDMEVGSDENFTKTTTVTTTIENDSIVTVNPDLFNSAIQTVMTKEPGDYEVHTRFVAYAELGTTRARLGGLNAYYLSSTFNVHTLDAAKVIEDSYYLVNLENTGTEANPIYAPVRYVKMENTQGNSISPYDNPEFAVKIDVADGQQYLWEVIPASSYDAGTLDDALGCNPAEDGLSGKLVAGAKPGDVSLVGPVLITVNIEEESYSVNYALDVLYPLSGTTLAKPETAMLLYTDNYISYTGVAALNGTWYCAGEPSIKGLLFRNDVEKGFTDEDGVRSGYLTTSGTSNLSTPLKGNTLYWTNVNLVQLTYSIAPITKLALVGEYNGWNEKEGVELTPSKDLKTWTATGVHLSGEFKINANDAWTISFGGPAAEDVTGTQVYNVVYNGPNCSCTDGTYDVTVDFSTKPYTITLK